MMTHRLLSLAGLLVLQAGGLPSEDRVTPLKVADLDGYSEGIALDSSGAAFVSLLHRGAVVRIRPGGAPEKWLAIKDPNGHRIASDGTHLIAARGGIYRVAPDGRRLDSVLIHRAPEVLPNDLALDGNGGYYVTAPAANGADLPRASRVFYVDSLARVTDVARSFLYPNGIAVRADGRVLYIDDSGTNRVYTFDIVAPGQLRNRAVFAILPDSGKDSALDGMTLDAEGRLYVAHYGVGRVEVLDTAGRLLRRYRSGNVLTSNLAFGGPEVGDLLITGAPADENGVGVLNRINLGVRGRNSRELPAPRIPSSRAPRVR